MYEVEIGFEQDKDEPREGADRLRSFVSVARLPDYLRQVAAALEDNDLWAFPTTGPLTDIRITLVRPDSIVTLGDPEDESV